MSGLMVLIALASAQAAPACEVVGVVRSVSEARDVRVLRLGDPLWRMLKVNDKLCASDRVRTWLGASAELQLSEDISGTLDADSDVLVRACGVTHYSGAVSYVVPDGVACPFAIDLGDSGEWIGEVGSTVLVEREAGAGCDPTVRIAVADVAGALVDGRTRHGVKVFRRDGASLGQVVGGEAMELRSGRVSDLQDAPQAARMLSRVRTDELRAVGVRAVPTAESLSADDVRVWIASERPPARVWVDGREVRARPQRVQGGLWELAVEAGDREVRAAFGDGTEWTGKVRAGDAWVQIGEEGEVRLGRGAEVEEGGGLKRVSGAGGVRRGSPRDEDGDGIVDSTDNCPSDPETPNAWRDEDGCPDSLADLDMSVLLEGKTIAGADVDLRVGEAEQPNRTVSQDVPHRVEGLMPDQYVTATARLGKCLAGEGSLTLAEGGNALPIALLPLREAKVVYEVADLGGNPLPGAIAIWRTEEGGGCVDAPGYEIGPQGRFEHQVGVGTHSVFVNAPGYRIYREEVTLAPGDVHVIGIRMQPTRVTVDKQRIVILERVFFETGLAVIKPESYSLLDEVAAAILAANVGRVRVEGHTDDSGTDEENFVLSQRRADAVRLYLMEKGVPEAQLVAVGYGATQPIVTNATAAGRAENRRVVFTLLDQ